MSDVFAGDSSLLAKVLGRLQSVEASLVSLTNSSDGERAAEDVSFAASSQPLMRGTDMRGNLCAARAVLVRARMWSASRQCLLVMASLPAACAGTVKTLRRHICTLLLRQQRRCGVTFSDCCCGSRDVAASHSHICCCGSIDVAASHSQSAVAAAETLRRPTRRLLLRQQRPCSVTLCDHCSGSTAGAQRQRQRRGHLAGCSMNSVGGMHLEFAFAEKVV